jgi:hypothetical protein
MTPVILMSGGLGSTQIPVDNCTSAIHFGVPTATTGASARVGWKENAFDKFDGFSYHLAGSAF